MTLDQLQPLSMGMYHAYVKQASGTKRFDGLTMPTWEELGVDQRACWHAAARHGLAHFAALCTGTKGAAA